MPTRFFLIPLLYAVALTATGQSYKKLHNQSIVIDTHNDFPSTAIEKSVRFEQDLTGRTHSDLQRMKKGGVDIQIFSIFCNEQFGKGTAYNHAIREMDSVDAAIARNPDQMMAVRNPAELQSAVASGKLGCMMGVEGGHMIEDDLGNLEKLYNRGARYMTLTWNNSTSWASSAVDERGKTDLGRPYGLTSFGENVVRKMNELGMIVDISHVGEQTFYDAVRVSTKPVIASHSNTYTLCPVPRNMTDDQIRALGKNGGVIHINFYSAFVDTSFQRTGVQPSLSQLIDHVDHIVGLIGVNHVGLGSDFDGISSAPKELNDVTKMPLITEELLKRGYSKKDVRKILGENFIRVFKENQRL